MKIVLLVLLTFLFSQNTFAIEEINAIEFQHRIKNSKNKFIILDVRTPYELKNSGRIDGAIVKNAYDPDIKSYVKNLDKKSEYIVYCHSGVRSAKVVKLMEKNGVNGINLIGGISTWLKKGLPVKK